MEEILQTVLAFSPLMGPLRYDPAEIEHPMYMFDHRCVGCVVLLCTGEVDAEVIGDAWLDEKLLPKSFFFKFENPLLGNAQLLGVRVRGAVEYGRQYTLRLENFKKPDGSSIAPMEYPLTAPEVAPVPTDAYAEHDAVAHQAARESIVLLKNEDKTLPLAPDSVLNLFGSGVTNFRLSTNGAGRINPRYAPTLRQAVREQSKFELNPQLDDFYALPIDAVPPKEMLESARKKSNTAIQIITRGSTENIDNQPIPGEYYLTSQEEKLMAALCETFDRVVVVLNTGYPIEMRWLKRYPVAAVLYVGLNGQAGAQALCEVLDGRVNPSGRLPDTWTWDYWDNPTSKNFYCPPKGESPVLADHLIWADTCYEEGIYVGYRYFETFRKPVAFAFGHGLSYTDFVHSAGPITAVDEGCTVEITVTNTGKKSGKDAVMLYAALPQTTQEQPARQLVVFEKTKMLAPGESQTLQLRVSSRMLATYVESENAWVLDVGMTDFYEGGSVREAVLCGSLNRTEHKVLQQLTYRLPSPVEFEELSQTGKQWPEGTRTGLLHENTELSHQKGHALQNTYEELVQQDDVCITYPMLRENPTLLNTFVAQLNNRELARLNVMYGSGWGMESKGEAGRLASIERYALPEFCCADGNSGVNVKRPNIGFPSSVMLCATCNTELAEQLGRIHGAEAADNGVQMLLGMAVNIHRNPLCGRHPEYFSEDPLLSARMAAAQLRGIHSAGISDSLKHVACNNCETARKRNHSLVGQRALREIYLRVFELLIAEEMPDTIMTAYNALNGSMTAENAVLIEGIFRDEFGFDGFAMTDWNSYDTADMIAAVNAGISWLTPGEADGSRVAVLEQAIAENRLSRGTLQRNVLRILQVLLRRV